MHSQTKRVCFGDLVFDVCDDVYEPSEDSFLFAQNLTVHPSDWVLDLGTGSGILAILSAKTARRVTAVDINPYAIRCAKANAKVNHLNGKMDFLQADLFSAFHNPKFNVILFNAPYLPSEEGEADNWIGRSWAGGASGRDVIDQFLAVVPQFLAIDGRVFLMQSTLADEKETICRFEKQGFKAGVVASLALPFFETLTLIEAVVANR
ncbi:MAG: class I SAM-dependent methyltransferase [Candidatus Bathyarchaeota archaeon]|nr:class I SAM-dependent methyltransferase [Candidatus Bathyarchaeota archaeon]